MQSSLERIMPGQLSDGEITGSETLRIHLERYKFATKYIKEGEVMDVACGVGYGSNILATETAASSVTGVDIDPDAISYAKENYSHPGIQFVCKDVKDLDLNRKFDAIISLETIEHLPDPKSFIEKIVALLKKNGVFICSVPVTPSLDGNPHHLNDFTRASIRRLIRSFGLVETDAFFQKQSYSPFKILSEKEERLKGVRSGMMHYYLQHPLYVFKRMFALVRYGFNNHYETIVWRFAENNS